MHHAKGVQVCILLGLHGGLRLFFLCKSNGDGSLKMTRMMLFWRLRLGRCHHAAFHMCTFSPRMHRECSGAELINDLITQASA